MKNFILWSITILIILWIKTKPCVRFCQAWKVVYMYIMHIHMPSKATWNMEFMEYVRLVWDKLLFVNQSLDGHWALGLDTWLFLVLARTENHHERFAVSKLSSSSSLIISLMLDNFSRAAASENKTCINKEWRAESLVE